MYQWNGANDRCVFEPRNLDEFVPTVLCRPLTGCFWSRPNATTRDEPWPLQAPWGNTNRVVSNRVVSKGPLYPSNTKTVTLLMFAGWNIPAQSNYRYIFLGPVLKPIYKSGFWEQPRLIRPRLYASEHHPWESAGVPREWLRLPALRHIFPCLSERPIRITTVVIITCNNMYKYINIIDTISLSLYKYIYIYIYIYTICIYIYIYIYMYVPVPTYDGRWQCRCWH